MSETLRIVYGPGDELALKAIATHLKEQGIDYVMLTREEDMDHAMVDMPFGYMRADKFARIIQTNGYLERMYGFQTEELYGTNWQKFIHPDDRNRLLIQLAKEFFVIKTTVAVSRVIIHEGFEITAMIIINSLMNDKDQRTGFRILIIDITQAFQGMANASDDSSLDALTKLPDRLAFMSRLNQVMNSKRKNVTRCALIILEIHGMDKINQLSGYVAGDNLLREFSAALRGAVDKKHFIGRSESNNFGIIVESFKDIKEIDDLIQKIQKDCKLSVTVAHGKFTLNFSMGVAFSSEGATEVEMILRHADEALKLAKHALDTNIIYFDENKHRNYKRAALLEAHMFNAISQDQLELVFQPQVDAFTEKLVGMEVLLRWNHPELGAVNPEEFIPIAEDSGFILQIATWVHNHALMQFEKWLNQFYEKMQSIKMAINISPLQLMDENLIEDLSTCLVKYHISPSSIVLELTEKAIMSHPETNINALNQLKHLGVNLSLDDFGTGYSSLNYLRSLPINQIKIDRSFIHAFQMNMQDAAVIKATILLADALGMEVVAEGVENEAELKFLRDNSCQVIQGFYFSQPLDAKEMTTYILRHA